MQVSLCHPDGTKSCGGCCGIYNRIEHSRRDTIARLHRRTAAFHRDASVADTASLAQFRARWEVTDPANKLIADLPNCPFVGIVDDESERVGCLVHPLQNDGVDGRDCGVYDRHVCGDYLCAAHQVLRPMEKWLVVEAIDESWLYGLIVTDPLFVRQLFERTADHNGASPAPSAVMEAAPAALPYFELKADWPYAASDAVFGQVTVGEGLETPRRVDPSPSVGECADQWEAILRCLGTEVRSVAELREARALVADRVGRFADAVAL